MWRPTYNIAPSHGPGFEPLIVVANSVGQRALRQARWWMIPTFWKKPLAALPTAFNARVEDLYERPFWKTAVQRSRCLVPATGWREFTGATRPKQPHHFHFQHQPFAFAGLWSTWISPDGEHVDSFAIVTTTPSAEAAKVHDRMPLVLPAADYASWIAPDGDPKALIERARAASQMRVVDVYPADLIGNNTRYEGPQVIAAAKPPASAQQDLFAGARRAPS